MVRGVPSEPRGEACDVLSEMHRLLLISPTPTWQAEQGKETCLLVFSLLQRPKNEEGGEEPFLVSS